MTEPTSSSSPQAGGDETPVARQAKQQLILSHLAKWENENGSLCAVTPYEWMALMEPIANLAVLESPRQALNALTRPTPAAAAGTLNQCDGCARGLPLANGIHRGPGSWDVQGCTASMYASPVAPAGVPTDAIRKALELGLHHARWNRDRSTDYRERTLNEQDVAKIEAAVLSAGAPAVPLLDEVSNQLSGNSGELIPEDSVHLAAPGSSRALRALTVGTPQWISVDERMPEPGTECLVWHSESVAGFGPYANVDCWVEKHEAPVSFSSVTVPIGLGWESGAELDDITHWAPIFPPVQHDPLCRECGEDHGDKRTGHADS